MKTPTFARSAPRNDKSAVIGMVSGTSPAELQNVTKRYGTLEAVAGVDLEFRRGEFFTLLGPSGSGKSTVLAMIAGLIMPTSGRVMIDGDDVAGRRPHQRNIGMVFQSLALFPHMDVFGNIAFALRMRRTSRSEVRRMVREALEMMQLPGIEQRHVNELSGGQRQRVALARALVYKPPLLLLDEPLGALDRQLREDMQVELLRLHRELDDVTIVNVTHDQREALLLSDRIGILRDGRLIQVGSPEELYRSPNTAFVASFLGNATLVEGRVVKEGEDWALEAGAIRLRIAPAPSLDRAVLVLRSEDVRLHQTQPMVGPQENALQGLIELAAFEGASVYYQVAVVGSGPRVNVVVPRSTEGPRFVPGDACVISWHVADAPLLSVSM